MTQTSAEADQTDKSRNKQEVSGSSLLLQFPPQDKCLGDRLTPLCQLVKTKVKHLVRHKKIVNLRKVYRHTAGWKRQNEGEAEELRLHGCIKDNKQHRCTYQTNTPLSHRGAEGDDLTADLQKRYQRRNSTPWPLCQNTHTLAGHSILAEKWYLAGLWE